MLKWDRGTKWQEWEHYCNGQTLLTFISRGLYCSCLLKGSLTNFQAIIYGLPPSSLRPLSGCKYPIQVDWGQLATTVKSLICSSTSAAKGMLMWPEKVSLKKKLIKCYPWEWGEERNCVEFMSLNVVEYRVSLVIYLEINMPVNLALYMLEHYTLRRTFFIIFFRKLHSL